MASKRVNVVLTSNAQLKNEQIRRCEKKQHRDDVTAILLSNGTISFNYTRDGKVAFTIDLCNCDEISILKSSNHTLCIKTGFNVNHLTLNNKSTAEFWYDTIVEELNKLGYNFNMEIDEKNPRRRRASEILIRPKTSTRRKKANSDMPNPDGYMYGQSVEGTYEPIRNTNNINEIENHKEYSTADDAHSKTDIKKEWNKHSTTTRLRLPDPPNEINEIHEEYSYTDDVHSITNVKKEWNNKHSPTIRPLPDPPNERNNYEVDLYANENKTDGPVEPIASVDRVEPVASVDDKTDSRVGQEVTRVTVSDGKEYSTENLNDGHHEAHLKNENIASVSSKLKQNQNSTKFNIRANNAKSKKSGRHINTNENVEERGNSRKNTEHLMREMSQQSIMISISKKKLEDYVVLAMMTGKLFIAKWKNLSLNHPLYEGDMILTINKQRIECIEDALKTIRNTATDTVDLVIVRLPYAKVVVIELQENLSDFGFTLEGRTVASVDKEGLAAMHGLRLNTPKAKQFGSFTETCVTAINCLPVNQHCTEEQTKELVSMHRDFVSLVVQPLDFITCLQRQQVDSLET